MDAYMKRWHEHQRELKEGGATWFLACLEYGHLPDVCPYEDPLFVQAFDRGEVETAEEWIHLKAVPLPQGDQETCLTCLKGEEWCFAVGKVGHKAHDQPPPWQEVELLVPKKGRSGGAKKQSTTKSRAAGAASVSNISTARSRAAGAASVSTTARSRTAGAASVSTTAMSRAAGAASVSTARSRAAGAASVSTTVGERLAAPSSTSRG
ncbi:UNVERIFIED_CONTAM: hypothetical protein FKN15_054388 [Acipenser sinensis]